MLHLRQSAAVGLKVVAAFLLYRVGRWLVGLAIGMLTRVMTARDFDTTLQRHSADILFRPC